MAFDSGFMAAVINEISELCANAKVEKVLQPDSDGIVLLLHSDSGSRRLSISASSASPKIALTNIVKDNPANPPMFCMLLRKHLGGARLLRIEQPSFERVAIFVFSTRDEMGFLCEKKLVAEIMGKFSNIILLDGNDKIISPLRSVDFSTSSVRALLGGMKYELPPPQDKLNPLCVSRRDVMSLIDSASADMPCDKLIAGNLRGIAPITAREIVYRASGRTDTLISDIDKEQLCERIFEMIDIIKEKRFDPCAVFDGNIPREYGFFDISHYKGLEVLRFDSFGELCDEYFAIRDKEERTRQRAADIIRLVTSARSRLTKKLDVLRCELADCAEGEMWQKKADLITANIYRLSRGMKEAYLTDYSLEEPCEVLVELDSRLTPAQNAQRMYKKYAKSKNAKIMIAEQIEKAKSEIEYLESVEESLSRADTEAGLAEIRAELHASGYASKMKAYKSIKHQPTKPMEFTSEGGYRILCGRNNLQNDRLTFKIASKGDLWFHVKSEPGSHVVMMCDGEEPSEKDYTMAATIAATNSRAKGDLVAVDYTRVKNIKKPNGAKPGYVIYHQNYTAYVTPDPQYRESKKGR
jgi:predicted ribosome quality control (RQC) complex YloA/Tae2 family protein